MYSNAEEAVRDLLGTPFVNGGRDKSGFDCWGLVKFVYSNLYGLIVPDYKIDCRNASLINTNIQEETSLKWEKLEPPEPPCIVIMRFNSPISNHIGVYIGEGHFLHTASKIGVNVDSIHQSYWKRHIDGFYRLRG